MAKNNKESKVNVVITIPVSLLSRVQIYCNREYRSKSSLISSLLEKKMLEVENATQ